jgi:hypothetical protein
MSRRPGTRILEETSRGLVTVDGVEVEIYELLWNGGGRSYDVYRTDTGACLTEDESLDEMPGHGQLATLLGG